MGLFQRDRVVWIFVDLPTITPAFRAACPHGVLVQGSKVEISVAGLGADLFRIPAKVTEQWIKACEHSVEYAFPDPRAEATKGPSQFKTIGDIASSWLWHLLQPGVSEQQLNELEFHVFARRDLQTYLVVAGKIGTPHPEATVVRFTVRNGGADMAYVHDPHNEQELERRQRNSGGSTPPLVPWG